MHQFTRRAVFLSTAVLSACVPCAAAAHEVYVLSPEAIRIAQATPAFSEWAVILDNFDQFILWAFIASLLVFMVFFVSISRSLERALDPFLAKLPPYAPAVGRIAIGSSFIASAYYDALFGPELTLTATFGALAVYARLALLLTGIMLIVGWYARLAALFSLGLFCIALTVHGQYMLTYANYFGELLLVCILGAHVLALHRREHDDKHFSAWIATLKEKVMPFAFPMLRLCFGISLIYASVYAKIIHNQLALAVASTPLAGHATSIASVFGFEPHFLVLGAAIVEITIGMFFILGIEIRFTSMFLLFWLTLSLLYFGETVWPHFILIGIPLAFIFYGYDKYSLEGWFFKREGREPVL